MERQSTDLITIIKQDHREVEDVFLRLEKGEGVPEERRELADHVIAELVRHSVAEEIYMYPAAREHLPNGDELADHEIEEHAEAERVTKELDGVDTTDPKFDDLLSTLMADVRHHIESEEGDLLPQLQERCAADQLRDLGRKFLDAKLIAPTRPHPLAPDTPPGNKILAPGAGLVDRMRDALAGRAT